MTDILVCGAGGAAQAAVCIAGGRHRVAALSLVDGEASRWEVAQEADGFMSFGFGDSESDTDLNAFRAKPTCITSDPSIVKDCAVVVLLVPVSSQDEYFRLLAPHAKDGTIFAVMPARSGCDYGFRAAFKDRASRVGLVACEVLPWEYRLVEWGKSLRILSIKETMGAAVIPPQGKTSEQVILTLQGVFGIQPQLVAHPTVMSISLSNPGAVIFPGITYGRYHDWDGSEFSQKPLFYHTVDDFTARVLSGISDEIQSISNKLAKLDVTFDTSRVKPIHEWYMASYADQIGDSSTLQNAMKSNAAYENLTHPMKRKGKGYIPDFGHRYLTEEVPTGLCFMKGVAVLLNLKSPTIDRTLLWCQEKTGKEYLSSTGDLGKDWKETRAPQAYGINNLAGLAKSIGLKVKVREPGCCGARRGRRR
eukprot:TRINITY_DN61885_c0_g1_i1.p1 TRINITY_DN61885_c0_g1~~TRINITY_DN61885_c0_g1_i1.p1  ORF type:complete len:443 (+),score=52.38 TRINITY_DN61885_c0_g1_i1:71-1330(+)